MDTVPDGLLALHLRQISLLALVGLGRAFYELQELAQGLAFSGFQIVKLEANSKAGIAAGYDSIEDQTLHPDFSIGHPQANLELYSGFHRSHSFDEAAAQTGIRQIPPNRSWRAINAQLHRDKTLHARITAAILSPAGSKNVRLERWRRSWCGRSRRFQRYFRR